MQQNENVPIRKSEPLMFQLRELVRPGSERSEYLHMTQSSCGGEDEFESE